MDEVDFEKSSKNKLNITDLASVALRDKIIPFVESFSESFVNITDEEKKSVCGRSYYELGKTYYDKADIENAQICFEKCFIFAERPRDNFSILKAYAFLIRISSEKKLAQKVEEYIAQVEVLLDELSKSLKTLSSEYFYNLGALHHYKSNFKEARENYEFALKKSKEDGNLELVSKCLFGLAQNYYNSQDFKESLKFIIELENIFKKVKKDYLAGATYHFKAKVLFEMGEMDQALENFSLANRKLHEKKCWNLQGYIFLEKGRTLREVGQYDMALKYFELALEITDSESYKRLGQLIIKEIEDVNDLNVDIYFDRINRQVKERTIGIIDFKHRFVLLEILSLLASKPGIFFDKEDLARKIWKDEYNPLIHDKLIYTSVSRLRKLIEPKTKKGKVHRRKYIIRGKDGYTFNPSAKVRLHTKISNHYSDIAIGNIDISSIV